MASDRPPNPRVAILGAGCAGLSLGVELVERSPNVEVVLFDRRTEFEQDRTWCGWTMEDAAYEECVSHRWRRCIVRGAGMEATLDLGAFPYRRIPADRYYAAARDRLDSSGRCEWRLGRAVENVDLTDSMAFVDSGGGPERFDQVFDGRVGPSTLDSFGGPQLLQHFVGQEIETDFDAFDPSTATLMDFETSQDAGIHFFYVLPFSCRSALVEATFMTPPGSTEPEYERRIETYLRERLGVANWTVCRTERGRIPMASDPPSAAPHRRQWMIGTAAGVVKPSTGYAFDAIHRDSRRVASAWLTGDGRPALPRSGLAHWMDKLMISFLCARPEMAPRLFPRLMSRCPTPRLVRFLNDRAGPLDYLSVIWASPRLPLARHCVRTLGGFRS